jgi:hypothetical protein
VASSGLLLSATDINDDRAIVGVANGLDSLILPPHLFEFEGLAFSQSWMDFLKLLQVRLAEITNQFVFSLLPREVRPPDSSMKVSAPLALRRAAPSPQLKEGQLLKTFLLLLTAQNLI